DVDLYVAKDEVNCAHLVAALRELGFPLTAQQAEDVLRDKDFVQLRDGLFDLDLLFARDGVEKFDDAWQRHVDRDGFPVAHIDDIIRSKEAANQQRDREVLPRLRKFRDWLLRHPS